MPRLGMTRTLCGLLVTLMMGSVGHAAGKAGTQWFDGTLAEALAQARKSGKKVLVKFEASWCGPCRRLAKEVYDSAAGREATKGMISVRVDFDQPGSRPLIERYVVLGLPTTVIVDAKGRQLSRIMGYDGRARYLALLAQEAVDPLPKLEAYLKRDATDDARLALGKALLVRSGADPKRLARAKALLEPLLWRRPIRGSAERRRLERMAEALFVLGRYHHRVRRQPEVAQHLWRSLATRCAETSWAGAAWWWFAKSQAQLGRPQQGAMALAEQHARFPDRPSTIQQWLAFAEKHRLIFQAKALREALTRLKPSAALPAAKLKGLRARAEKLAQSAAAAP